MIALINSFSLPLNYTSVFNDNVIIADSFSLPMNYIPVFNDNTVIVDSFSMGVSLHNTPVGDNKIANSFSLMYSGYEWNKQIMDFKKILFNIHRIKK